MDQRNGWIQVLALLAMMTTFPGTTTAQDEYVSDAERLVTALQLQPGQTIADIGAGRGQLAIALARELAPAGQVYATELDPDRLRELREAAESAGLKNVTVIEAQATRTNLPEQCCDALVLRRVYHHFDNPGLMNASMRQSLKPGGLLAVIDFAPDSAESADPHERANGKQHGVTSATVVRELTQAGFQLVAVEKGSGIGRFMVVVRRPSFSRCPQSNPNNSGKPRTTNAAQMEYAGR
jgi:ubiquinone/menaquinone biosynthesis C-methylase UbiE